MKVCKHLQGAFRVGNETMCQACKIKDLQEQLEQSRKNHVNAEADFASVSEQLEQKDKEIEKFLEVIMQANAYKDAINSRISLNVVNVIREHFFKALNQLNEVDDE